jgi:hypothetical protein
MSRIVEVFGTSRFEVFAECITKAKTYKEAMTLTTAVYGINEYTGKNILAFFALAECKYPWVDSAFSADEEFVAIGPNPAEPAICVAALIWRTHAPRMFPMIRRQLSEKSFRRRAASFPHPSRLFSSRGKS